MLRAVMVATTSAWAMVAAFEEGREMMAAVVALMTIM